MRRFNKIWRSVNLSTAKEKTLKINGNRQKLKNYLVSKLSHFIKPVTFCNNYLSHFAMTTEQTEIQDPEPGNQYLGPRILDLRLKIQIRTVDTRRKLNVQKTYRRRPGRLLNVLCLLNVLRTFNLCPVSTGQEPELGIQEFRSKTKKSTQKLRSASKVYVLHYKMFRHFLDE